MWLYIVRRLLQSLLVIIGVTLVLFALFYVLPGDPVRVLTGNRHLSDTALANARRNFHLDQPLYRQYFYYLKNITRGNLGQSFRYHRPVTEILREYYPNSIRLGLVAVALEALIGISAGILAAVRKSSFTDNLFLIITGLMVSVPVFWLGMLLQILFGVKLHWLPVSGLGDGSWRYYVLPAVTLAAVYAGFVAQTTRAGMARVLNENYIRTARAAGITESKIIGKYALKNAMAPIVTLLGLDLGALMGGAVAVEVIFNWPGIGNQLFLAIQARDRPLVMGAVLTLVLIFIIVNLFIDLSYLYFEPRLRSSGL